MAVQEWEYWQVASYVDTSFGETRFVVRLEDGTAVSVVDALDDLGVDGWELVSSVAVLQGTLCLYTLKRAVASTS